MYLACDRIARKEVSDLSMDTDEATCSRLGDPNSPHGRSEGSRMKKELHFPDFSILHTQSCN